RNAVAAARRSRRAHRRRGRPGSRRDRPADAGTRNRRGRRSGRAARDRRGLGTVQFDRPSSTRVGRDGGACGRGRRNTLAVRRHCLPRGARVAVPAARATGRPGARASAAGRLRGRGRARRGARCAPASDRVAHARLRRACAAARAPGVLARLRRGRERPHHGSLFPWRASGSRPASLRLRAGRGLRHRPLPGALLPRSTLAAQPRGYGRRDFLSHAAQPRQLLAVLAQRQHRARRRLRRDVLRLLPFAPRGVVTAGRVRPAIVPAGCCIGVTLALAAADVAPATPWRHLYLVPVALAGLRFGVAGGLVAALGATLAFGPLVLREIEGHGTTRAAVEGVVTLVVLGMSGAAVGSLATRAQCQRERYETLRAVQRVLADPAPLERVAVKLVAILRARLRVDAAGVVLDDGHVVAGAARVEPCSVAAYVLAHGEPVFVVDAATASRARRVVAVPLISIGETVRLPSVERLGDFSRGGRDPLVGLGAGVGDPLGNPRAAGG